MESGPRTPATLTNRGIASERAGNREQALNSFAEALYLDPAYEAAWLWYAAVTDDPGEQRYCLDQAIAINPESVGRNSRAHLIGVTPVAPAALADLGAPPLPPAFGHAEKAPGLLSRIHPAHVTGQIKINRQTKLGRQADSAERKDAAKPEDERTPSLRPPVKRTSPRGRNRLLAIGAMAILALAIIAALAVWLWPHDDAYYVAVVGPMSGPDAYTGKQIAQSAELMFDQINGHGGIAGHKVRVLTYDDQNKPDLARQRAEEIVKDGRVLAVIGHVASSASLAAAPIYTAAGIPAITPASTTDALTEGNPWFFRTVFTNSSQGTLLAIYANRALGFKTASVIYSPDDYGKSLYEGFSSHYKQIGDTVKHSWSLNSAQHDASIKQIVDALAAEHDPGILVLAMSRGDARDVIRAIRDRGLNPPMMGADAIATPEFAHLFSSYPKEQQQPGYYTNELYAASPFLLGSAGGDAVSTFFRFRDTYGYLPGWWAAKAYDAATLASKAISTAKPSGAASKRAEDRRRIRDELAAINSPATAIAGISSPLYFDKTQTVPQSIWMGQFDQGNFTTAPVQYLPVANPYRYNLPEEIAKGTIVQTGDTYVRRAQIVYTGMDINELRSLDTADETYEIDFFVWFRYQGPDTATNVTFTNAINPNLSLGDPLESRTVGDLKNRVFRVHGTFKEPLNFRDYPWDTHDLTIRMQNATLGNDDVIYVTDPIASNLTKAERLRSGLDATKTINQIPNWNATNLTYYQNAVSSDSALGDPRISAASGSVQYSQFVTDITIGRDVRSFLIKNLLPLALLALVTYISLFFSPEQAGTRIGFAITSVLTSAVLLGAVSNQLPDIGYTVAIEWGFYGYIGLSAFLILANIMVERLYKQRRYALVRQVDTVTRILYPVIILAVIAVYAMKYA